MPIDLYHLHMSPPCQSVRLVAAALGVELNLKTLNLMEGEHLEPEFLEINPQDTIPTIDDDGFILWDSRAICTYLIDKYGQDDSFYPKDPQQRALINQRLYFDLGTLFQSYAQYIYPQALRKELADPAKLEKCIEAAALLDKFIEGQDYVAGDHLTVADILLVVTANCYTLIDMDMSKYENVQRWMEKIPEEIPQYNEIVVEGFTRYKEWIESKLQK